jgi:hypothetical protein
MTYRLLVAALPITGCALYLAYLHLSLSRKVECRTTHYLHDDSVTLPDAVQNEPEKYVVHHECARGSVSTASLRASLAPELPTLFLRHTMTLFSRSLPAWGIWYLLKSAKDRSTFDQAYIRSLRFEPGDRVCGVYVVTSKHMTRITLALDAPQSYTGPVVEGMLVVEVREEGNKTTFVNHTIMWREKGRGSAGVLESAGGRWMHGLMVKRLVDSGIRQVLLELCDGKSL